MPCEVFNRFVAMLAVLEANTECVLDATCVSILKSLAKSPELVRWLLQLMPAHAAGSLILPVEAPEVVAKAIEKAGLSWQDFCQHKETAMELLRIANGS